MGRSTVGNMVISMLLMLMIVVAIAEGLSLRKEEDVVILRRGVLASKDTGDSGVLHEVGEAIVRAETTIEALKELADAIRSAKVTTRAIEDAVGGAEDTIRSLTKFSNTIRGAKSTIGG
ncbi:hypothetical protein K2173_008134 [Erythroxylum novogranatense]|uniref:Uncharacterized protein n=1 Tax=Erythroxylum novogranatense TaxID=1862640 RepID=A0AAV8S973_9ROSI|nr:hypothetical protein K2173_008134 [Erythroxylum novogranatense]